MFISGYANTENVFYRLINCVLYNQNQRHGYSQWKGTKENDKNQSELEADYAASKKRGKTRVNRLRLVLVFFLIGWKHGAKFFNQNASVIQFQRALLERYCLQCHN